MIGLEGGDTAVGSEGVAGRLLDERIFVIVGTEGVVGALIVVVGLGS